MVWNCWKRFWTEEDGMGTVEIVMIIAARCVLHCCLENRYLILQKVSWRKCSKTDTVKDVGVGG